MFGNDLTTRGGGGITQNVGPTLNDHSDYENLSEEAKNGMDFQTWYNEKSKHQYDNYSTYRTNINNTGGHYEWRRKAYSQNVEYQIVIINQKIYTTLVPIEVIHQRVWVNDDQLEVDENKSNDMQIPENNVVQISMVNATAAFGVGPSFDFGGLVDGYGQSKLYLTIGWVAGFGYSAGMGGVLYNKKNGHVDDIAGNGLLISGGFGPGSFEFDGNWKYGEGWIGDKYRGLGASLGVGIGGIFIGPTYTFVATVPDPSFWNNGHHHF